MRSFAILFALVLIVVAAYAAPESTGDCHIEPLGLTVKRGEEAYPEGECVRVECSKEGTMDVETCEIAIGFKCHIVNGDMSKKFPGCCPTVKCDRAWN